MGLYHSIIKRVDFIYVAPALLCNFALLSGIIPSAFCLDGALFAKISVGIFILSIFLHIYILFRWRKYQNSSPVAYGIVQPCLHLIILMFALVVGETSMCAAKVLTAEDERRLFKDYDFKLVEPR